MVNLFKTDEVLFTQKYLSMAKEKAQFVSCLLEIIKNYELPLEEKQINTPILFDATCSGIQHLSALTTDIKLGQCVNLFPEENPQDFYQVCADYIIDFIDNLEDIELKNKLSQIKIDRKFVKKPVMTIPYNISLEGLTDQILNDFIKYTDDKKLYFKVPSEYTLNNEELVLTGSQAGKLGAIVFKVVSNSMPNIKVLRVYFNKVIDILSKLNLPVS